MTPCYATYCDVEYHKHLTDTLILLAWVSTNQTNASTKTYHQLVRQSVNQINDPIINRSYHQSVK